MIPDIWVFSIDCKSKSILPKIITRSIKALGRICFDIECLFINNDSNYRRGQSVQKMSDMNKHFDRENINRFNDQHIQS